MNDERQNKSEEQEGECSQKLKSKCAQKNVKKTQQMLLFFTTTDYFCENDSFLLMLTLRKYKHQKGTELFLKVVTMMLLPFLLFLQMTDA